MEWMIVIGIVALAAIILVLFTVIIPAILLAVIVIGALFLRDVHNNVSELRAAGFYNLPKAEQDRLWREARQYANRQREARRKARMENK